MFLRLISANQDLEIEIDFGVLEIVEIEKVCLLARGERESLKRPLF